MRFVLTTLLIGVGAIAYAHEMTPAYLNIEPSYVDGVAQTSFDLFNRREDVNYYELSVYDEEWNTVPFATTNSVISLAYLERKRIEVYFRDADKNNVTYICTTSKLLKSDETKTIISSRICSKVK